MIGTDVVLVGGGLVLGVLAGLVAHEWSHAVALRAAGVDYVVEFFPESDATLLGRLSSCPWGQVRPLPAERDAAWTLRFAALAPIVLALPVAAFGLAGYAPTGDAPVLAALAIGWLACAIPSPQDFSVAFHAQTFLDEASRADGRHASADRARTDEALGADDATAVVPRTRAD